MIRNETLQINLLGEYDDDVMVQCQHKGVVYDIVDITYPEEDDNRIFLKLRKARKNHQKKKGRKLRDEYFENF